MFTGEKKKKEYWEKMLYANKEKSFLFKRESVLRFMFTWGKKEKKGKDTERKCYALIRKPLFLKRGGVPSEKIGLTGINSMLFTNSRQTPQSLKLLNL